LQSLEMRLDTLVFRLGFAPSRRAARQFVTHGHIMLNGAKMDVPSTSVKEGAKIEVKNKKSSREFAKLWMDASEGRPISPWLALDKDAFAGTVLHTPSRTEIAPFVNEQLVVELYSK